MTRDELNKATKQELQDEIRWKLGHNVNINQPKEKLRFIIETFIGIDKKEECKND